MKRALIAVYRVRMLILLVSTGILLAIALFGPLLAGVPRSVRSTLVGVALCGWGLTLVLVLLGPRVLPHSEAVRVESPVRGRWLAMNSPASKVPSHGVRMYGQAYAIDLVHEPDRESRPVFGTGSAMRPNDDYPAFGQPVFAMVDGVVVKASDWRRDHRARSTVPGLLYLMVEGMIRELGGPGFIVGNHVTIRTDEGQYATVAHLQRGSVSVRVGDTVRRGSAIAKCGNSGNSTEPHVHAQLMDRRSLFLAQGVPMVFTGITLGADPELHDALPRNEQHMGVAGGERAPR
ncbi:M23 family metallopeptidase [Microbacterium profundi]|uniref:M23 family metallopeptidase n=1 Tax=Microbacterium profundi TaxID=450380 RepID=A0ABV3LIP1_9MICO